MAFGLIPLRLRNGAPWNGSYKRYKKEASVILGIGDPVVLTGSSEAVTGIPLVTRATAASTNTITGVVVGIEPVRSDLTKKGYAAADTGYIYVVDDFNVLFMVAEDGDTTPMDVGSVGNLIDLATIGNASTTTWVSTVALDSSTIGSGTQFRVIELLQRADNAIMANTSSTPAIWVVAMHQATLPPKAGVGI